MGPNINENVLTILLFHVSRILDTYLCIYYAFPD